MGSERTISAAATALRQVVQTGIEAYVRGLGSALEGARLPPDDHRPWPVPSEPWVMAQTWSDALFAHWALPPSALQRFVPPGLVLDIYDGAAWLGITAFVVSGARLRGLPAVPGLSTFAEVNVRTYVTAADRPGVLFLSLDAASAAAVVGARAWFRLPYYVADATATWRGSRMAFRSRREHRGAPAASFNADYRPAGAVQRPAADPLTRWLTERYCLYTEADGRLLRAEIHHQPWPIQAAEAELKRNTLAAALELALERPPDTTHYAAGVDAVVWPPRAVRARRAAA